MFLVIGYYSSYSQTIETCDYSVPTFMSDILNLHSSGCYTFGGDRLVTSSEEIISHPASVQNVDLCGAPGQFTTFQSDKFIELLPGFNSDVMISNTGFEIGIEECGNSCPMDGTVCDDLDPCTENDTYNCDVCIGTPGPDTDGDGTCDAIDGCPNDSTKTGPGTCGCGVPDVIGTSCDDGNPCTFNDVYVQCGICEGSNISGVEDFTNVVSSENNTIVPEISGLTYNEDTGEFIAVSDNDQWSRREASGTNWIPGIISDGSHCDSTEFSDVEAITYMSSLGNSHQYAMADERDRIIAFVDIGNNQTLISHPSNSYLKFQGFGCGGNDGIEGIAYHQSSNTMYFAIQNSDQKIYSFVVPNNINGQTVTVQEVIDLDLISGLRSTHGIAVLDNGNILALVSKDGPDSGRFLERIILEIDACGNVLGELELESILESYHMQNGITPVVRHTEQLEGIVAVNGDIYLIGEVGRMYQLSNSPNPFTSDQTSQATELREQVSPDFVESNLTVYPNPVQDNLTLELTLAQAGPLQIDVFNLQGKFVHNIVNFDFASKGEHMYKEENIDLQSGIYFIRVQSNEFTQTHKITKF